MARRVKSESAFSGPIPGSVYFVSCRGKKNPDFYENQNPSKHPQNTVLAKNGPHNRNQRIFLTNLDQFSSQKLHGTPHSCKICHFPRVFTYFRPGFQVLFLRYSHSLYKTHTADLPVSSFPIGISHTTLPAPPWTPLIRDCLHFISGKPIANSHSGRRQRGLGGGNCGSPTK